VSWGGNGPGFGGRSEIDWESGEETCRWLHMIALSFTVIIANRDNQEKTQVVYEMNKIEQGVAVCHFPARVFTVCDQRIRSRGSAVDPFRPADRKGASLRSTDGIDRGTAPGAVRSVLQDPTVFIGTEGIVRPN
jgi:hypothetical protein